MPRRRRPQDKVDHLLDELLADYSTPSKSWENKDCSNN
ncbi:hypothetical protein O77CONTIG1_01873 [Leptolyngbya sp. O-77]|nr:hypothetical protein O77CONTIG1_00096 [Leptolyngbya sp. O-77]BAU42055.1 hypothetical protein O77CONTIG1_01873 [Leptolyngbya sp. O-77]